MHQDQIDAGFDHVRAERFLRAHLAEARNPDFWRAMNPELSISDRPTVRDAPRARVDPAIVERATRQIADEGFLLSPPLLPRARVEALRLAAGRVVDAGFPSGFVCVYDQFYQAFQGLDELFAPLLGDGYLMVLQGLWTYSIPAGDSGFGTWTTAPPHRDVLGPDPRVVAHGVPSMINVWIPITDITPDDSCIYVVPAPGDPDYFSDDRRVRPDRFRLQDVRALPAPAGSVIGWSMHLVHWGSRSSRLAAGPRVAITVYFQRRDVPPVHPATLEFGAPLPFAARVALVGAWLGVDELAEQTR